MLFNIDFEICSLFFLIILMFVYNSKRKYFGISDRVYGFYLLFAFLDISLDIISVYTITNAPSIPLFINYIINSAYLVMQSFITAILFFYIASLVKNIKRKFLILFSIPAGISALLALSSPLTHLYFYFDAGARYTHGPLQIFLYANGVFYTVLCLVIALYYRRELGRTLYCTSLEITGITIAGLFFQFLFREYLLSGTGIVMSLLIIYLNLQNPDQYTDSLTGVLNRKTFIIHLNDMQDKHKNCPFLIISLNNFKLVNEIFGVSNGDILLRSVAQYLSKFVSSDSVYRIGGDMYALILSSPSEAESISSEIQERFQYTWSLHDAMNVSLSPCICYLNTKYCHGETSEILKTIDYAVLEAKKSRKNAVYHVDTEAIQMISRKAAIEQALSVALERQCFEVHYQPIYSTASGTFTTLEALARLYIPSFGYIPPDEFIQIAEQNGIIIPLGMLIMEEVCRFIRKTSLWTYGFQYVEVNLSVIQCMQEDFAENLLMLLEMYDILPIYINLEITETAASFSENLLMKNIQTLLDAGITFSMDDYGSGYSTINYLANLPFTYIKLDKHLVWSYFENEDSKIIMGKTVEMLKLLNYKIIAEGVETESQAAALSNMNIDYLQGYYYSKPIPGSELLDLVSSQKQSF